MLVAHTYHSPAELATALIDIPSITGSEAGVLEFLEIILERQGIRTEREEIGESRWNLYGGWTDRTDVVFCSHVDTVPPFFPSRTLDSTIFGRGACDTKGIIAAMIFAGQHLIEHDLAPAYLFVVGEETDSIGAKTAARSGRTARYIVVGEPTDNMLASGHKGALSYTIVTRGVAAHSAYPERGTSAIHALLDILEDIRNAKWGWDATLGDATTNIGKIDGGVAMNTLAPEAKASVMHRIVDDTNLRRQQVLDIIGDRAEVHFHSVSDPQFLHTVEGFPFKAVAFGTDIPYLRSMATCLLFGPGSVHDAHTPDEHIETFSINEAVELYVRLYHALRSE